LQKTFQLQESRPIHPAYIAWRLPTTTIFQPPTIKKHCVTGGIFMNSWFGNISVNLKLGWALAWFWH
jgi:hypothetical protein